MLLSQFILWLIVFPLAVITFLVGTAIRVVIFLFNCPVDIWNMLGDSIDKPKIKEENIKNQ